MRTMGLDVGPVRVGVALSDELGMTAGPLETIEVKGDWDRVVTRVAAICQLEEVDVIVLGLPLSLSGGAGGMSARRAQELGDRLGRELQLEIAYWDERFTTTQAERALLESGMRRQRRRQVVDKVAAALILQGYLDAHPKG